MGGYLIGTPSPPCLRAEAFVCLPGEASCFEGLSPGAMVQPMHITNACKGFETCSFDRTLMGSGVHLCWHLQETYGMRPHSDTQQAAEFRRELKEMRDEYAQVQVQQAHHQAQQAQAQAQQQVQAQQQPEQQPLPEVAEEELDSLYE